MAGCFSSNPSTCEPNSMLLPRPQSHWNLPLPAAAGLLSLFWYPLPAQALPASLHARDQGASWCCEGHWGIVFHELQLLFSSAQPTAAQAPSRTRQLRRSLHARQPLASLNPVHAVAVTIVPLSPRSECLYFNCWLSRQEPVS